MTPLPERFPRWFRRDSDSVGDGRWIAPQLVLANALGVSHADLGDAPRYVIDVRAAFDGDESADALAKSPSKHTAPHVVRFLQLPVREGSAPTEEQARAAVAWFRNLRAEVPDALVVVNCLAGAQRSAVIAYAILRAVHGLGHDAAMQRVGQQSIRERERNPMPNANMLFGVRAWCERGCP